MTRKYGGKIDEQVGRKHNLYHYFCGLSYIDRDWTKKYWFGWTWNYVSGIKWVNRIISLL